MKTYVIQMPDDWEPTNSDSKYNCPHCPQFGSCSIKYDDCVLNKTAIRVTEIVDRIIGRSYDDDTLSMNPQINGREAKIFCCAKNGKYTNE